jgi:hypothetical protein
MQGARFDALTRWMGQRSTRRTAVTQAGMGLAAALGLSSLVTRPVAAQVATPVPVASPAPVPSPAADASVSLLYVQYAGQTMLVPGTADVHTLVMTGVRPQTIYFSDRPNRITGAMPLATFVDSFATMFATSAPNASLIGHLESGGHEEEAVVVTLLSATYDEAAATLTYEVRLLDAELITDVAFEQEPLTVFDAAREYAEASLFIDNVNQYLTHCETIWNGEGCNGPDCCPQTCAELGTTYVMSDPSYCHNYDGTHQQIFGCLCQLPDYSNPTPTPPPPPAQDLPDCREPGIVCEAYWECNCGSYETSCYDTMWDIEPGTDCCPARCESEGATAVEPGILIPVTISECCGPQG